MADVFRSLGVKKVRLTGGEPTVRKDIVEIVGDMGKLFPSVGITTNGSLLSRKLERLKVAGLTHLNISLDSLVAEKNELITRRPNTTGKALESMEKALGLGFESVKLNVVAMKNFNDDEFCDFVDLTRTRKVDIRFIEFMPFSLNDWEKDKFISYKDILGIVKKGYPDITPLGNDEKDSTSKAYKVPGFAGQLGFISSMSDHFCGGCNRLRITADGNLKVCLFDNREVNLKHLIEAGLTDDELITYIRKALDKKHFSHGGVDSILGRENRPMVKIGG